jgi:perosamine synthetase
MIIPLSSPDINELDKEKVLEVLNTPNLSLGPKLAEFEEKFADYIGSKFAIAINSGTSGLHLCIKALDIKDGDEVLTTPFSFIASANCILFERAKPVFVDIDEKTLNIDVNKLTDIIKMLKVKSKKLKSILPVHVFGKSCEMGEIMELAERYELKIIEDACEAIGAEYLTNKSKIKTQKSNLQKKSQYKKNVKGEKSIKDSRKYQEAQKRKIWQKVGTFGDCGVFAFYPNKQITTGEGGMVVTNDDNIFKLCKSMRNQGRSDNGAWLEHKRLGYNYRISDINCALGIAQLKRIDTILAKREKVAKLYNERLKEIEELIIPQFENNKKISWFVYVVRLPNKFSMEDRNLILEKLKEKEIGCSNYFSPIHLQPFYREMFSYKEGNFPVTEKVSERTIALPFYNNLKEEQIDYVCENLKKIIQSL